VEKYMLFENVFKTDKTCRKPSTIKTSTMPVFLLPTTYFQNQGMGISRNKNARNTLLIINSAEERFFLDWETVLFNGFGFVINVC
jgi:hypothetical protein